MADMKLDDTLVMDRTGEAPSSGSGDAAPKRVAHYDIKREIGQGTLSVVYEAEDTQTGQEVALKLLTLSASLTPLEAEALVARFEREARTAARLSHPNIVHIHEVGADQGRHFLAMEYLKGQTLRARMRDGALTPSDSFSILSQIAGALDAVHKAGIVHRDVKPTNMILLPNGTAKLLDFGIACSSKETTITRRGMIIGSPSYMAPEQIKGEAGTKATDIWALGVLGYEMLTGQLPFTGQNVGGVMFHIMHEAPAPMPALPPAVQQVLRRALDKRPSQRYPTAGAFVQALKLAYPKQTPVIAKQAPAAPERKAAEAPRPQAAQTTKPASSLSLPGPKWLPEAALLGLFLLGFCGAFFTRQHTFSDAHHGAVGISSAQSVRQSVPASAPPRVLLVPQLPTPQPTGSDVPPAPVAAVPSDAPAVPAPLPVQAAPQKHPAMRRNDPARLALHQAPVPPAKGAAVPIKPLHTVRAVAAVPVPPPHAAPVTHPASVQVASRHLPEPAAAPQPVARAERSEPEPTSVQPGPAPSAAPPVPAQRADQAVISQPVTLPSGGDGYDPEADARRRKSAWSQDDK